MRNNDPYSSSQTTPGEERLQNEVEELRKQIQEQKRVLDQWSTAPQHAPAHAKNPRPSGLFLTVGALLAIIVVVAAFFMGYLPHQRREAVVRADAHAQEDALPRVNVLTIVPASGTGKLVLSGDITAVTEAPILARTTGFIKTRKADIGDHVQAGQVLAEIEDLEIDQQVDQAQATVQQAQAAIEQATASLEQGKANAELARVTADRWGALVTQGVVSKQDNDQYQAQYKASTANVSALEKAVAASRSNVAAAQANLARLRDVQGYRIVKAPFAGVITVRNIDVGTLITAGTTLMYRIAQTDTLRAYVDVPQSEAGAIHVGQAAQLRVSNLPGKVFRGTVARTANSLDTTSRTLLVDVQIPNFQGLLMPGMYADVDFNTTRVGSPLVVPGDAMIVRSSGTQVAIVDQNGIIHFKKVTVGRDYGDHLEITTGLEPGDQVILHPNDTIREGVKVDAVAEAIPTS